MKQPRQYDLEELKKDGVTTVVNLRVATYNTLEKAVESLNRKGKLKPREIQ